MIFFYNLQLFVALNFRRFIKTHTLTHTGKGAESTGQGQTGFFLSGPVFSAHLLADDTADGVRRVLFHLRRGVSVGVQGEASRVVAQGTGQRFDPRRDPRTEKPGRKQRNKAHLRGIKSCDKPALFSRNPAEDIPIESSHA